MRAANATDRNWRLLIAAVAVVLTIFVMVDVRRRGRTSPLPPGVAASIEPEAARRFPFGRSTSSHRTDLTAYTAAAHVLADGGSAEDAYRAQSPRGWRYQYLPLLAALLMPISFATTPIQSLLFGLLSAAIVIALLFESRAWWRLLARPPDAPAASLPLFILIGVLAATILPALNSLQRGQVGLLIIWPLMLGFRWMWMARSAPVCASSAALLAFPAVLKFIPMMPAGIALLMAIGAPGNAHPRRAIPAVLGFGAGVVLFAALVPGLLIGPQRTYDASRLFVQSVVANPEFSSDWQFEQHSHRNQSFDSAAWKLLRTLRGDERVAADPLGLVDGENVEPRPPAMFARTSTMLRVLLTLLSVATAIRMARDGVRGAFAGFGVACLATLVVSPVSWGHHFTMLLPTMLAVPAWLDARGRSGTAFACSLSLGGAVMIHYAAVDLAGPIGLLGLTATAVLVVLLLVAWQRKR